MALFSLSDCRIFLFRNQKIDRSLLLVKYSGILLLFIYLTYSRKTETWESEGRATTTTTMSRGSSRVSINPAHRRGRPRRYVRDRAMAITRIHRGSLMSVKLSRDSPTSSFESQNLTCPDHSRDRWHRDAGRSDSCFLTANLYIKSFSIKAF